LAIGHLLCLYPIMSRQNPPQLGTVAAGGRAGGSDSTFVTVMVVVAVKRAPPTASVVHMVLSKPSAGRPTTESTARERGEGCFHFGPESASRARGRRRLD